LFLMVTADTYYVKVFAKRSLVKVFGKSSVSTLRNYPYRVSK
jgi:hypothetical protein